MLNESILINSLNFRAKKERENMEFKDEFKTFAPVWDSRSEVEKSEITTPSWWLQLNL